MTRYNASYGFEAENVPACQSHYDLLKATTWEAFGKDIMYDPHGPVHVMIGGVGNANWLNVMQAQDYNLETAMEWVTSGFAMQKNMYRRGWLDCPATCSLDTPMTDCKCTCPNATAWKNMSNNDLYNDVLKSLFVENEAALYNKVPRFPGFHVCIRYAVLTC